MRGDNERATIWDEESAPHNCGWRIIRKTGGRGAGSVGRGAVVACQRGDKYTRQARVTVAEIVGHGCSDDRKRRESNTLSLAPKLTLIVCDWSLSHCADPAARPLMSPSHVTGTPFSEIGTRCVLR